MVGCIKEMLAHGKISEEYFDDHDFPLNTTTRGEPVPSKFTDAQYHLMRTMLPLHDEICQRRSDAINDAKEKKDRERIHKRLANPLSTKNAKKN